MKQIILLQTHRINHAILALFRTLKALEGERVEVRLLYHCRSSQRRPRGIDPGDVVEVRDADIEALGIPMIHGAITPGCQHFPLLHCHATRRFTADYYWLLEYDVRFSGNWRHFFGYFDDVRDDLLCAHLAPYAMSPHWNWWRLEYRGPPPRVRIPDHRLLRAFLPVMRLSAAALDEVYRRQRGGWVGHSEVLIPTLLRHYGYTLRDIGGGGVFVREDERDLFYTGDNRDPAGTLSNGTMRFRPAHRTWGDIDNKLYHPVKN